MKIEDDNAPIQTDHRFKLTSKDLTRNYLKNIDGQTASVLYGQCN